VIVPWPGTDLSWDRDLNRVQEAAGDVIDPDKVDHVHQPLQPEGLLGLGIQVGIDPAFE
jgi:hypothetical protein